MIAVLPQWFPPGGRAAPRRWRARCSTPTASRCTRPRCRRSPGAVLCSLASSLAPHVPSAGRARLAAARARGRAARLHLARLRLRAQRPRAELRPAPRLARPRTAPSASPRGPSRPSTSSAPASPACRCRRSRARRGWSSRRAPATPRGRARPINGALGGLPVAEVEPTPNGPTWWGTGKLVESVVFPVDVAELAAELVAELEPWLCRWCRELIARSPCPLCGHRGAPASVVAPPAAHQQGGVRK